MNEAIILATIRLQLGKETDLVLWRNECGVARHEDEDGKIRTVRYGLIRGSSDLVGILAPRGRLFALEVKTETGVATREQELFLALVRKMGGFAAVVRCPEEASAALERARRGATL